MRWRRAWTNIVAVAYREAIILRHDRAFIGVVVMQPIMMILLFGLVLSNKPANVPWGVIDRSGTVLSRRLVDEIQSTGYFLPPERVPSYERARALLGRARLLAVLVVPSEFRRDVERKVHAIRVI